MAMEAAFVYAYDYLNMAEARFIIIHELMMLAKNHILLYLHGSLAPEITKRREKV